MSVLCVYKGLDNKYFYERYTIDITYEYGFKTKINAKKDAKIILHEQ